MGCRCDLPPCPEHDAKMIARAEARKPAKDPKIEAAAKALADDYAYLSQWPLTPEAWYQMARRVLEGPDA